MTNTNTQPEEPGHTGGHTPGPWLAAAKPSSVVGLPVVATPSGRSIASVSFFHLGEAFAAHDRESHANARLIAAAPDLLSVAQMIVQTAESSGASILRTGPIYTAAKAAIARATQPEAGSE